ncbi:tetratricopeptide repeat protein [Streptomyces sp. NPDC002564]|uniref:tetratricopeptide repeat protein n=1 Tax=Streptomyces sp. NPDC002564 TaxID=3364649 RepID=UPI0036938F86
MPSDHPNRKPAGRRHLRSAAVSIALGAVLFTAGALGLSPQGEATSKSPAVQGASAHGGSVDALQQRVRHVPADPQAWSALGMAYVQQARQNADPALYAKAESALRRSLKVRPSGNDHAETAMGALAAGRHDFTAALAWSRKATTTNPYSSSAHGVLADAYTQLGRYEQAFDSVQRMIDLRPDSTSLARASYMWELRGERSRARALMARSLRAASSPAEQAFAHAHLSLLALDRGDARTALREARSGLRAAPHDSALLEARARAHAALGDTGRAVRDYRQAIAIAPLPHYLLGLGELQQSLGRREQAREQYDVLRAQDRVRQATGAAPDTDAILFEADHGNPRTAVALGRQAVTTRPFLAVHDAYAWALHQAGRDDQALVEANRALALHTQSALFHFHRGIIHQALGHTTKARQDLGRALAIDGRFHPLHAPQARTALRRIDGTR